MALGHANPSGFEELGPVFEDWGLGALDRTLPNPLSLRPELEDLGLRSQDLGQGSNSNSLTSRIWSQAPRILGQLDEGSWENDRIQGQGLMFWGWAPRILGQLGEGSTVFTLLSKGSQENDRIWG